MIDEFIKNIIFNISIKNSLWDYIIDICTIITPIVIGVVGYRYTKKKDINDGKLQKIEKIANYHNLINFNNSNNYIQYYDNKNVDYLNEQFKSCVLFDNNTVLNGYYFYIDFSFSMVNSVMPHDIIIDNLRLYDEGSGDNQLFINGINRFKDKVSVTIDFNNNINIKSICYIDEEKYKKIKVSELKKTLFVEFNMSIYNKHRIITDYYLKCECDIEKIESNKIKEYGKIYNSKNITIIIKKSEITLNSIKMEEE